MEQEIDVLAEDKIDLQPKLDSLQAENSSLKDILQKIDAQRIALSSTVKELLDANINLKAGAYILEAKINELTPK